MFIVKEDREKKIRDFIKSDPPIAVILAAIHFEWCFSRANIHFGKTANIVLRRVIERCRGLKGFKKLWKKELSTSDLCLVRHLSRSQTW